MSPRRRSVPEQTPEPEGHRELMHHIWEFDTRKYIRGLKKQFDTKKSSLRVYSSSGLRSVERELKKPVLLTFE